LVSQAKEFFAERTGKAYRARLANEQLTGIVIRSVAVGAEQFELVRIALEQIGAARP